MATTSATDEIVSRGRDAWDRVKKHSRMIWTDWLAIGEAIQVGRSEAMRRSGANQPAGRGYNETFSRWLGANGFGDMDKGARSRLFDIMENRSDVEEWREQLDEMERLSLNHPNIVWRKWQAWKRREGTRDPAVEPRFSKQDTIVEQQNEIDRLNEQVASFQEEIGGGGIGSKETNAEILEYLDRKLGEPDLIAVIDGLIALADERGLKRKSVWGRKPQRAAK
jgi:hypothetical protein